MPSKPSITLAVPPAPHVVAGDAELFELISAVGGTSDLIEDVHRTLAESGVLEAVQQRDDAVLFEWLMAAVSYQGIGDAAALRYMDAHGRISAGDIGVALTSSPPCPKLAGYWLFEDCRYHKGSRTCAEPEHLAECPLPLHDLRNGRLNQTAYSLFMFFRDVAKSDIVGWIDERLARVAALGPDRQFRLGEALLEPLGHVHGVSHKVLSMALADLLLAAGDGRPLWREAGAGMVAVDSLVHNWMHRTGVLARLGCDHPYGTKCYGPSGCASIIAAVSDQLDARAFNADYPKSFPRFVQHSIWRFCA